MAVWNKTSLRARKISTTSTAPLESSMVQSRYFQTLDEFNRGYAGPQTLLLEKKCRELAGRQDDFCLICGDDKAELFPQLGPKEIHLCPRRFCKKCYYIEAGWKKTSARFNDEIYQESEFVPLCCTLCWKRGWDISNPLLGRDQPEWQTWTRGLVEDALNLRHKYWEECAVSKEFEGQFKWRLPLRHLPDDMTLESDRELLKAIKIDFLKNSSRFNRFEKTAMLEASPPSGPPFNVRRAFEDIVGRLLGITRPSMTEDRAEEQKVAAEEIGEPEGAEALRERGNGEEHEAIEQAAQCPQQPNATRPQRRAARLNFNEVNGGPVRQSRSTPQNNINKSSPKFAEDVLDHQTGNSKVTRPSARNTRLLHKPTQMQQVSRPRGRPRNVLKGPTTLSPSPSTRGEDVTPGPSSIPNEMAVGEDFDNDEWHDKIKAIIDHVYEQNKKLKELKGYQTSLLQLVSGQLEESRTQAKTLEEEQKALSMTESELRRQLSSTRAANAALQRTIEGLKQEHGRQSQTIDELNARIAQHAKQTSSVQNLQGEIDEHKRKYASLEADLEISRATEAKLKNEIAEQREVCLEMQGAIEKTEKTNVTLKKENRDFFQGIARREQELEDLRKATGTMDRKSRAIRSLREDQDEVMEANKQLRKDVANLGAELAIARGLREVDGARMQQVLACGSLTSDLVDRLVQNSFLETQMSEKIREQAVLAQASSDSHQSQTSGAKRRRTGPALGLFD